ncbi:MAG: hypothetical protein AAFP26_12755, partial [Planctomycetota bacterium]
MVATGVVTVVGSLGVVIGLGRSAVMTVVGVALVVVIVFAEEPVGHARRANGLVGGGAAMSVMGLKTRCNELVMELRDKACKVLFISRVGVRIFAGFQIVL